MPQVIPITLSIGASIAGTATTLGVVLAVSAVVSPVSFSFVKVLNVRR